MVSPNTAALRAGGPDDEPVMEQLAGPLRRSGGPVAHDYVLGEIREGRDPHSADTTISLRIGDRVSDAGELRNASDISSAASQ